MPDRRVLPLERVPCRPQPCDRFDAGARAGLARSTVAQWPSRSPRVIEDTALEATHEACGVALLPAAVRRLAERLSAVAVPHSFAGEAAVRLEQIQ